MAKPGWLKREMEAIAREVAEWPEWMRQAAGIQTEEPITDAERVAAMKHNKLRAFEPATGGARAAVRFVGENEYVDCKTFDATSDALDAWVRHLRSTGWTHNKENQ